MRPAQAAQGAGDGDLAGTLVHESSHGLGRVFARKKGRQLDISEAIGRAFSGLEEAKADVTGMFGLEWLMDHGALPKQRSQEYYASYVAGIFRTLRFGTGEAHGRAEMMEFNYLLEQKAISRESDGRYAIDYVHIPEVIARLAKQLLDMEATGDRARAEAWFAKYDKMPAELKSALATTSYIPVDIYPKFSFPDNVE